MWRLALVVVCLLAIAVAPDVARAQREAPVQQVAPAQGAIRIEAMVLDVPASELQQLGLAEAVAPAAGAEAKEKPAIGTLARMRLFTLQRAITRGETKAKVLWNPSFSTADQKEGRVEIPKAVIHYMEKAEGGLFAVKSMEKAASVFTATPKLTASGVELTFNLDMTAVASRASVAEAPDLEIGLPALSHVAAASTVTLASGDAAVVAGLIGERDILVILSAGTGGGPGGMGGGARGGGGGGGGRR